MIKFAGTKLIKKHSLTKLCIKMNKKNTISEEILSVFYSIYKVYLITKSPLILINKIRLKFICTKLK